jgi:hypothetical protein
VRTFDFQLMRWLSQAPYSGSEIGECYATAHLIDDGDNESWLTEWQKTARRVEAWRVSAWTAVIA